MISSAIHHRYGHGVARLPIGPPIGSTSLSESARRGARAEIPFALSPTLICIGLALFLASASADRRAAETIPMPVTLSLELWEEPGIAVELAVAPAPAPTGAASVEPLSPTHGSTIETHPTAEPSPQATAPAFDPRSLVMSIVDAPAPAPTERTPIPTLAARPTRPRTRDEPLAELATGWPVAFGTPSEVIELAAAPREATAPAAAARRQALSNEGGAVTSSAAWTMDRERSDFLASLEDEAETGIAGPRTDRPRPPVAAPRSVDAERAIRREARRTAGAEGWREVPLDDLPDCSPPGRQDALKQRILQVVSDRRSGSPECTSPEGRFRFLGTRNLNAFLMWSRTQSASSASRPPDRDVCDVLERALRCLGSPSLEEY